MAGGICVSGVWQGGICGSGACMAGRYVWQWGICGRGHACVTVGPACAAGEIAVASDGTYPTGMHSC